MTRKQVKAMLPILQAFAEGKTIQHLNNGSWGDITKMSVSYVLTDNPELYRIKPELKYRPFTNAEECRKEMQKHPQPELVLEKMYNGKIYVYRALSYLDEKCCKFGTYQHNYNDAFRDLVFVDGTPFGIEEE